MFSSDKLQRNAYGTLQVIEMAKPVWKEKHSALLPRTEFVGGRFFDKGGHAVLPNESPAAPRMPFVST